MPASRPKDAATLILLRKSRRKHEVLMGRRRTRDVWSKLFVFPGGRVDRSDGFVPCASSLRKPVERRLLKSASPHRARALGVAAIRETWEEAGVQLAGRHTSDRMPGDESWLGFHDQGFAPALDRLHFLCRAITPPYRPKRFNARFFVADAENLLGEPGSHSAELSDIQWVTLDRARTIDLPNITGAVLSVLEHALGPTGQIRTPRRTPLFKSVYGKHRRLLE